MGGPITDEDRLFIHRLSNPGQSDLERVIRADERRKVAEEIARECATKAAYYVAISDEIEYGLNIADGLRGAAEIARKFAAKGAEQ
ncbi:MAG TPA: hypothetical protein VHA75_18320 [Rugosimonospora sp.]|nr:hypothetical protein [Rugosimonospora sp.]